MRQAMTHHVIVLDEYGGTVGIVTFDDLMERVVGAGGREDLKAQHMTTLSDGSRHGRRVDAGHGLERPLRLALGRTSVQNGRRVCVGRLGRRPEVGDRVEVEGCDLRVEAVDGRRVAWITLSKPSG